MAPLLSFHRQIIEEIAPPEHDDLLILAKGLGLRKILCTMMKIYDSEHNLILLVRRSDPRSQLGGPGRAGELELPS
jgi:DNA excision repair protein ERCC-4